MAFVKKYLQQLMMAAGGLSAIAAILIFILGVGGATAAYKRVLFVILGILLLGLTGLCAVYVYLIRDHEPNFFLFDRTKKKNIRPEQLTFTVVNERMNFLQTMISASAEELWTKNILENAELGYRNVYRPLVAYKMLFDLADKDIPSYWELLYQVKPDVLDSLCKALEEGEDQALAAATRNLLEHHRSETDKIREFVCKNMKYIRSRMMAYIRKNIDLFY